LAFLYLSLNMGSECRTPVDQMKSVPLEIFGTFDGSNSEYCKC
jgi:hypothetical protein